MIRQLIERLSALDPPPTAEELADALWLVERFRSAGEAEPPAGAVEGSSEILEPLPTSDSPRPDPGGSGLVPVPGTGPEPQAGLFVTERDTAAPSTSSVRIPAGPAIPSALRLARALRPLRVTAPSPADRLLDENETAQRFAETGILELVTQPSPERWFDLALVVDTSPSMGIWQRTVAELESMLIHLGAFRDVRLWRMDADSDRLLLRAGAGSVRSPDELTDPTQRRLVLVMSDCIGAAWQDGRFAAQLERWGRAGPVAIVQPLPQRLWWRCGASFERVTFQAALAGVPNSRLIARPREIAPAPLDGSEGIAVPVLELEPRWLLPWASAVANGRRNIEGMALFTGRPKQQAGVQMQTPPVSATGRVMRFRASASPMAYRLAGYLAAAPLRLPVMRLVQVAMLRDSMPSHLAEVFLGDLLRRADPEAEASAEETEYEFHEGVREVLLSGLHRGEALKVLRMVWYVVRDRMGSSASFPALLRAIEQNRSDLRPDQQFAQVACQVLTQLGGRYTEIAQRLTAHWSGAATSSKELRNATGAGLVWDPALPSRNPDFTGRDDLLRAIRDSLDRGVTVLLPRDSQALGGEGKSQLAVEYAYRYAAEHDLIWWIPSEQSTSALAALDVLAERLGTPRSDDRKGMLDNVFRALREGRPSTRWLLIFDDARDPAELLPFIPAAGEPLSTSLPSGAVLITSRDRRWERHAGTVEVDVFQRLESITSLRHFDPRLSDDQADELAGLVHDLPLAVAHAGIWQTMTDMGVDEYLRVFERRVEQLSAQELPENFPIQLAASVSISVDRLREENPAASALLELWAYLGPEPVDWLLLADGADADLPEPLPELLADGPGLLAAMADIERFQLGSFDQKAKSLEVHRLVRALLRSSLSPEEHGAVRGHVQRILAAATPSEDLEDESTWRRRAQITPHVGPAEVIDGDSPEIRSVVLDQARYLYLRGDFFGSRLLAESAYEQWRERFGTDDESVLNAERALANALRALGEMDRAATLNGKVLEKMRRRFGPAHLATLRTANGYGADLRFRGDFVEASRLDRDTWNRMLESSEVDRTDTLLAANNVAIDFRLFGEFEKARDVDRDALHFLERNAPELHRDLFRATHHLGRDLRGLGRYGEAVRTLRNGLSRAHQVLGSDHAFVLQARMSLADALRKAGDVPGAEEEAEEMFEAHLRRFGAEHPNTLAAKGCLAMARTASGDPQRGRLLSEEALDGYRRTMGGRHPFVHACASGLGIALRALGNPALALDIDKDVAAGLRQSRLGADHYYALCAAVGLANDHYLIGDRDRAEEIITAALAGLRSLLGRDHPYPLAAEHNLRLISPVSGPDPVEALIRSLGENHPDVLSAKAGRLLECDIEPTPL